MEPLVSIIIPTLNIGKYFGTTIKTCLAQTYSNIEIIIVDGGSTDETLEIAKEYEFTDPRVKVISAPGQCLCAARNTGVAEAKGEYIKFFDGDDMLLPYAIEHQVRTLIFFQVPFTIAEICCFTDKTLEEVWKKFPATHDFSEKDLVVKNIVDFLKEDRGATSGCLFLKKAIQDAKGYEPSLKTADEINMWLKIAINNPEANVACYAHPGIYLKRVGYFSAAVKHAKNTKWHLMSLRDCARRYLENKPANSEKLKTYLFNKLYFTIIHSYRAGLKKEAITTFKIWKQAGLKPPTIRPQYHHFLHHAFGLVIAEKILSFFRFPLTLVRKLKK